MLVCSDLLLFHRCWTQGNNGIELDAASKQQGFLTALALLGSDFDWARKIFVAFDSDLGIWGLRLVNHILLYIEAAKIKRSIGASNDLESFSFSKFATRDFQL